MNVKINGERLNMLLKSFARIGATEHDGVNRPGYSDVETAAHDLFVSYMASTAHPSFFWVKDPFVGSWVNYNPPGFADQLTTRHPIVMAGHLDSVPDGGRLDGTLGVAAGMEVLKRLAEERVVTKRQIRVVAFCCEESSRFGRAFIGSSIAAGKFDTQMLDELTDHTGATLRQCMFDPHRWRPGVSTEACIAQSVFEPLDAMLELHIEQGPVLDHRGMALGVVSSIAKARRFKVSVFGSAGHTGTTPMRSMGRRDALVVAASMITSVQEVAAEYAATRRADAVATVDTVRVHPNSMNVIPSRVDLGIDVRCGDGNALDELAEMISSELEAIASRGDLEYVIHTIEFGYPVTLDKMVHDTIVERANASDMEPHTLPGMTSGAGHDCMNFADLTRAGMIFVPSINGISHHHAESTNEDDIEAGAQLLLDTVLELDEKLP